MHRLTKTSFCFSILALAGAATACGGGKKGADNPEATYDIDAGEDGNDDAEKADGGAPERKKEACVGFDIGNLEDLLTLTSSPTRVAPGGKADLLVTFANKTNAPLPLRFRIDPLARFETEVYDAKKKRADVPPGNPPPPPKGHSAPPPAEQKVGMVTVAPNGSARVRVPWEAVKMKWAPNKVRGTAVEKGYPRVPSGALAKGKYTVKVVTPLIGVFEGGDHEMSSPSVEIEVGL